MPQFCTQIVRSYVTAQVCIQKRANRYSRFILVVEVKDSFFFFFPLWIQLRGNSFFSNNRKAFCFAVYCQCAPLIQKYWRIFLKEKSGNYLSIRSTSVVSSAEVRGLSAEHNICVHCNSDSSCWKLLQVM